MNERKQSETDSQIPQQVETLEPTLRVLGFAPPLLHDPRPIDWPAAACYFGHLPDSLVRMSQTPSALPWTVN